jgi:hypothetical protein
MVMLRFSEYANLLLIPHFRAVQRAAQEENVLALIHLNSFSNTVYKTLWCCVLGSVQGGTNIRVGQAAKKAAKFAYHMSE